MLVGVKELGHKNVFKVTEDEKTGTRFYRVEYDTPESVATPATEAGIPAIGDQFDASHPTVLAKSVDVRNLDEDNGMRQHYLVQVDYTDKPTFDVIDDPLTAAPDYEWDFSEATEKYFIDKSSTPKAVCNTAGQPFDEFPERETGALVCTVTKNVAKTFGIGGPFAVIQNVNTATMTLDGMNLAPNQAKLSGINLSKVQTNSNNVSWRTLKLVYKLKQSWDDKFADVSYVEKDTANPGKVKDIIKGTPPVKTDKPWPLNGSGSKKPNSTDVPAELTFKPYTAASITF